MKVGDDPFESKRRENLQKLIKQSTTVGEQNKQIILNCIQDGMPEGKTTSELVNEMKLDRDTIYTHCKWLEVHRFIFKEGKFGKYRLTTKFQKSPVFMAQRLMKEILQKLSFKNESIFLENPFTSQEFSREFQHLYNQDTVFFENYHNRSKMDAVLMYEFANRIGAVITYLIIQAFQFSRDSPSSLLNAKTNLGERDRRGQGADGTQIDKIITEWINKAIQPYTILNEFVNFMNYKRGWIYNEDIIRRTKKPDNNNSKSWSFYEIERSDYQRFLDAFAKVYPYAFNSMEHIKNKELPGKIDKSIEWHDQQVAYLSCRPHIFKTHTIKEVKYFTCIRCEQRFKAKISNIVTDQDLITKLNKNSKKKQMKTCEKQNHIWIRSPYPEMSQNKFECFRCYRWLMVP